MNDRRFPWVILVPARPDVSEIVDLGAADRAQLIEEIALVSTVMRDLFRPTKLNVGALGNVVAQLHVHVVARFASDDAWPGPVWGTTPERYRADEIERHAGAAALSPRRRGLRPPPPGAASRQPVMFFSMPSALDSSSCGSPVRRSSRRHPAGDRRHELRQRRLGLIGREPELLRDDVDDRTAQRLLDLIARDGLVRAGAGPRVGLRAEAAGAEGIEQAAEAALLLQQLHHRAHHAGRLRRDRRRQGRAARTRCLRSSIRAPAAAPRRLLHRTECPSVPSRPPVGGGWRGRRASTSLLPRRDAGAATAEQRPEARRENDESDDRRRGHGDDDRAGRDVLGAAGQRMASGRGEVDDVLDRRVQRLR